MNADRRYAVVAGGLFIIATMGVLLGRAVSAPFLDDPVDLTKVAANEGPILVGALLKLIGAAACPGIALAMYPVLRRRGEGPALGSVAFRIIEGAFYAISVVGLLLLVSLSREAAVSGAPGSASFGLASAMLVAGCDWIGFVAGVLFFGVGALLYYWVLYRSALVPRWLSGWGIAGALLALVAALAVLLQLSAPLSTVHLLLNFPIFVQEIVLAVWLIAKGFNPRAIAQAPAVATPLAVAQAV